MAAGQGALAPIATALLERLAAAASAGASTRLPRGAGQAAVTEPINRLARCLKPGRDRAAATTPSRCEDNGKPLTHPMRQRFTLRKPAG